jgi:hypothetical protein
VERRFILTILGYELDQIRKTVVAFVVAVLALVGLFVAFDPNLEQAAIAVVIAAFNVVAVFNASASPQDIGKTVKALVASGLALVGLFHTFNPDETEKIIAAVGAAVNVLGVFFVSNRD